MRNRLLATLSAADRNLVHPHLQPVDLMLRTQLQVPGEALEYVHFIEHGLASVLAAAGDQRLEVGIVGFEGYVGVSAVLGLAVDSHEIVVQIAGSAHRIASTTLRSAMESSATLRAALLGFAHVQLVQTAQTALANGRGTVEQRLARWLLMTHDRIDGDEIPLTHDFLAVMLGVRRPGVTVALHVLEGEHAIRSRRGSIQVTDRAVLKRIAGPLYGETEREYERLFGPTQRQGLATVTSRSGP